MDQQDLTEDDFKLYYLDEVDGRGHSFLRAPHSLPKSYYDDVTSSDHVFNILMADASGSMKERWRFVVEGWQEYIVGNLTGRSKIYIFDTEVRLQRNDKVLLEKDFTGYSTNLTAAFETIREEITSCRESHVNVFLITDGQHNFQMMVLTPDSVIKQMTPPPGKTVCVYVLGIGYEFPVGYSVDIRSHLHNGNSNVPTLFWAKWDVEIKGKLSEIGAELKSTHVVLDLNLGGYVLPGTDKTRCIHLGEWIYFPHSPEDLPPFTLKVNGKDPKPLAFTTQEIELQQLIYNVFRQWNSVMIQQHRKGSHVPYETFDLMESLYNSAMNKLKRDMDGNGVKSRILYKLAKSCEVEYATLKNQSKNIIDIENQYGDEIKLAEAILKTTVTARKYDQKNLKFKGHGLEDFEADMETFKNLYEEAKGRILALPSPSLDECCRVTLTSTLKDLQDPNFHMVLNQDKFNFLKTLSMTGIPAYAPVRDASQINPWTIAIRNVLVSPYDILSQAALEAYAKEGFYSVDSADKSVLADSKDEKTRFNIVIPIVPANAAKVLKPLVCSNLYAMLSTFCILKNPHVIDYSAHLASLAAVWIATIRRYPIQDRPEFISIRLQNIIATAKLYMSRPSVKTYITALISDPDQALMTESTREFDGHTVKCESLVKPMFFLYIGKDRLRKQDKETMLKLLLAEFVGRSLPSSVEYADSAPYTEFFARDISSPKKKQKWIENNLQSLVRDLRGSHNSLLEVFFTPEELLAAVKKNFKEIFYNLSGNLASDNFISIDMTKIKDLRNVGSCGDVRTSDFKSWAEEMGISAAKIKKASSPKMVTVYACEALQFPSSRDRVSKAILTVDEALATVKHHVMMETTRTLKEEFLKKVTSHAECKWREEYAFAHRDLVMPMTPTQIVPIAQSRGVDVTLETFKKVYRYSSHLQLLRNACQMPECPHFLMPRNTFNQHLSVERQREDFPHALHLVSKTFSQKGVDTVMKELTSGDHSGTQCRKRPEPPKQGSLAPMKGQLSDLLNQYNKSVE